MAGQSTASDKASILARIKPPAFPKIGAIHLESNVNLYLSESATLPFSTDPKDYLPVVFMRLPAWI
jgi:hypothetical protein